MPRGLAWVQCQPLVLLLLKAVFPSRSPARLHVPAAAAACLSLLLWAISCARFRLPVWQAFLYSATSLCLLGIAVRSALWHALGRNTWKGRPLR